MIWINVIHSFLLHFLLENKIQKIIIVSEIHWNIYFFIFESKLDLFNRVRSSINILICYVMGVSVCWSCMKLKSVLKNDTFCAKNYQLFSIKWWTWCVKKDKLCAIFMCFTNDTNSVRIAPAWHTLYQKQHTHFENVQNEEYPNLISIFYDKNQIFKLI